MSSKLSPLVQQTDQHIMTNSGSPLLGLPIELTYRIFDLSIAKHDSDCPMELKIEGKQLPEIVISHTCKQWREAALSYPWLWTRFFFRASPARSIRKSTDRFEMYIGRSNDQNLELFLDFGGDKRADWAGMMDKAAAVVKRWKIVTLISDSSLQANGHCCLDLIVASAPNLEYFVYQPACTVFSDWQNPSISDLNPTMFKAGTPNLRYLQLDCSSYDIPSFSNVTTLRIESKVYGGCVFYSFDTFLEILSIPALTNLSVAGEIFVGPITTDIPIISMNNLKHLRISENECTTIILPFLRAPLLQTLWIHDDSGFVENDPFPMDDTELYFFPSLHTLILLDATPTSPDLAGRLMQMTRNITNFLLSDNQSHSEFGFLTPMLRHGLLNGEPWPNLTSFTASFQDGNNTSYNIIADFLHSRSQDSELKLRLFRDTHLAWEKEAPNKYKEIKGYCTVEVIETHKEMKALLQPLWPPGVDCPDYSYNEDPFIANFLRT